MNDNADHLINAGEKAENLIRKSKTPLWRSRREARRRKYVTNHRPSRWLEIA
jgi:hypothetical protein